MDREIHHSHGFYGMIVTPACRRFPQIKPPRNGKLQGFSRSVAVHEGIVLGTQVSHIDGSHQIQQSGIAGPSEKECFKTLGITQGSTLDLQFPQGDVRFCDFLG